MRSSARQSRANTANYACRARAPPLPASLASCSKLSSGDARVAHRAAQALARLAEAGPTEALRLAVPALVQAVDGPNAAVAADATIALGSVACRAPDLVADAASSTLSAALRGQDGRAVARAAWVRARRPDRAARPVVARNARQAHQNVEVDACLEPTTPHSRPLNPNDRFSLPSLSAAPSASPQSRARCRGCPPLFGGPMLARLKARLLPSTAAPRAAPASRALSPTHRAR